MNYSSKNTISQQKADGPSDSLGITQSSGLDRHAVYSRQRVDDFRHNDVASTQSARQYKDATDLICQQAEAYAYLIRRLTPLECERLQGFPDGWTDIPGASDSARYKALGNSIALPFWRWMFGRMAAFLPEGATLGSLFDGIGGFPLCWESIHGKGTAVWASEIEPFPIRVTEKRLPENLQAALCHDAFADDLFALALPDPERRIGGGHFCKTPFCLR